MTEHGIPIWFFIGALLLVYGVLIFGAGIWGLFHPPPVALAELHVGIWWGALLVAIGLAYVRAFPPRPATRSIASKSASSCSILAP